MSNAKIIKNPEVPGLECFLPLPPPPPPPATSSTNGTQNQQEQEQQKSIVETSKTTTKITTTTLTTTITTETITSSTTVNPNTIQTSIPNLAVPTPYILHPTMQPQTPTQPAIPWWISTEADTSADMYAQWYDTSYKTPPTANTVVQVSAVQQSSKSKNKYKRKNEFIDPAQDAEKVASAQRELSALMKPLKCDLCNAVMNSTMQAKLHYNGKPHQKKVTMFLNQSVKKQKSEDGQVSSTTDWQNRCDICKTWFSSQIEASQHYTGKKHIRVAHGGLRSRPKKSQNQNQYNQIDSTGRYGIGIAFQQDVQVPGTSAVVSDGNSIIVSPQGTTTPIYTPPAYPTPLRCDLCGVSANRQDQLETHKRGSRHMRMLKLNGLPIPELLSESEHASSSSGPIDYSIYRTPSGQYYCAPCNLSLNSESKFAQHVESKKHKNQSIPKSPLNAAVISKKARFKKK